MAPIADLALSISSLLQLTFSNSDFVGLMVRSMDTNLWNGIVKIN